MERFFISEINGCKVFTASCPNGASIEEDLSENKNSQSFVLSLLDDNDIQFLKLEKEEAIANSLGITFKNFPIGDMGIPVYQKFVELMDELLDVTRTHQNLIIHCQHGIGRSGTMAVGLMLRAGFELEEAKSLASKARSMQVPQSRAQNKLLNHYAQELRKHL